VEFLHARSSTEAHFATSGTALTTVLTTAFAIMEFVVVNPDLKARTVPSKAAITSATDMELVKTGIAFVLTVFSGSLALHSSCSTERSCPME